MKSRALQNCESIPDIFSHRKREHWSEVNNVVVQDSQWGANLQEEDPKIIVDCRRIISAHQFDPVTRRASIQQTRKIDLQGTGQVPERCNGRAAFSALDL